MDLYCIYSLWSSFGTSGKPTQECWNSLSSIDSLENILLDSDMSALQRVANLMNVNETQRAHGVWGLRRFTRYLHTLGCLINIVVKIEFLDKTIPSAKTCLRHILGLARLGYQSCGQIL